MVTITCIKCEAPHEAASKRAKYCDSCRTPPEHKNSSRNILARKALAEEKRQTALATQAAKNARTAEKRRTMPFFDDAEELDWLIKEQENDAKYGDRVRGVYFTDEWGGSIVDNSFEENLDALCEIW